MPTLVHLSQTLKQELQTFAIDLQTALRSNMHDSRPQSNVVNFFVIAFTRVFLHFYIIFSLCLSPNKFRIVV